MGILASRPLTRTFAVAAAAFFALALPVGAFSAEGGAVFAVFALMSLLCVGLGITFEKPATSQPSQSDTGQP